jgi:RHS repeat-associated protein
VAPPILSAISGSRYYNPERARWINRDPIEEIGFREGHPESVAATVLAEVRSWNLYVFVANRPSGGVDVLGAGLLCVCPGGAPLTLGSRNVLQGKRCAAAGDVGNTGSGVFPPAFCVARWPACTPPWVTCALDTCNWWGSYVCNRTFIGAPPIGGAWFYWWERTRERLVEGCYP